MPLSGILVQTVPGRQARVAAAAEALDWAQVHQQDAQGRIIVTVDSADSDQGQQRLKALKALPGVVTAEMLIHCFADEVQPAPDAHASEAYLNAEGAGEGGDDGVGGAGEAVPRRSFFNRLKAIGNY